MLAAAGRGVTWAQFFSGRVGAVWDVRIPATMRQSRTTGAFGDVGSGNVCGVILDAARGATDTAGAGIHMVAPTDARRATLVGYDGGSIPALYASGSHGYASSAALDLSASDEVTVIMQVRKLSDASGFGILMETSSTTDSSAGAVAIAAPYVAGTGSYVARSIGTSSVDAAIGSGFAAPDSAILVMRAKISADYLELLRNGTQIATSSSDQGSGNYGSHIVNWMCRNAASAYLFANAEFGTTAIIGGALTADELATAVALAAY